MLLMFIANIKIFRGGNRVLVRLEEGDKVVVNVPTASHIEGSAHVASTFSAVYLFD